MAERMEHKFLFHISSEKPCATVTCPCGWSAKGNDVRRTFARADGHACPHTSPTHDEYTLDGDYALDDALTDSYTSPTQGPQTDSAKSPGVQGES
jgi:hypothetical protein